MKKIFASITRKQFVWIASGLCFAGDVFALSWIYLQFGNKTKLDQLFKMAFSLYDLPPEMMDSALIDQAINRFLTLLWIAMAAIIVFHLLNYWSLIKEKTSLIGYLKLYSFTGAIGFLFLGVQFLMMGAPLYALSGLFGLTYLWVGLGLVYFFDKKRPR
jgi:hypothetical protein